MADLITSILRHALAAPSDDALAVMRLSLADWLAVGWMGSEEEVAKITRDMVLSEGGQGAATLFGGGTGPARGVALANGAASHALDLDDTHFAYIGHPSVAVIPAALAVAEMNGASPQEMIRAALAGCEASIRFGIAFGRNHYQQGFHQTATAGAFGACVAAMRLLSDDTALLRSALNIASTRASGLKSQFGTMGKPYNAGIAATNGVEAALLAIRGFTSSETGIDGPLGFLQTHHTDGTMTETPGFLMQDVSHKFHACCHGLHACLEALEALKPIEPATVQQVTIRTNPRWMSVCNKPNPRTGLEAKFSYTQVTALSLLGHDTAALNTFEDALCHVPEVTDFRKKVRVIADDSISETAAQVTVDTTGGTRTARFDISVQAPLTVRTDKLKHKLESLVGPQKAARIWSAVHNAQELSKLTNEMC